MISLPDTKGVNTASDDCAKLQSTFDSCKHTHRTSFSFSTTSLAEISVSAVHAADSVKSSEATMGEAVDEAVFVSRSIVIGSGTRILPALCLNDPHSSLEMRGASCCPSDVRRRSRLRRRVALRAHVFEKGPGNLTRESGIFTSEEQMPIKQFCLVKQKKKKEQQHIGDLHLSMRRIVSMPRRFAADINIRRWNAATSQSRGGRGSAVFSSSPPRTASERLVAV